jgi:16S rRNA (cytosine967-C5)-methyltransferase
VRLPRKPTPRAAAAPARRAAFSALLAVSTSRRDSASALAIVQRDLDDPRDAALAAELVLGVLRWQAALDAALQPLVSRPLAALDIEVLTALRLGTYQRLFLTRIPAAAAVNDSVSLVRGAGRGSAAGLANAVLRRIDRDRAQASWPVRPPLDGISDANREAALAYLSTTHSHPSWLAKRWLERYGFAATERWVVFDNTAAPLTIRPVTWRITLMDLEAALAAEGVTIRPAAHAPDALIVTEGNPYRTTLAARGVFVAQDEASQLVAHLATSFAPRLVLDACASPGGKTTYIRGAPGASGPGPRVIACDLRQRRVDLLRATLAHVGAGDVPVVRADLTRPAPFDAVFDLVLLDAPCSGLGTIRREPEIRWRRSAADLAPLAAAQQQMLAHGAACVRRGGHLVYATCSSEPDENENVVDAFLHASPQFERVHPDRHPWSGTRLHALLDTRGDLRTTPHEHGLEAFYAAALRRIA